MSVFKKLKEIGVPHAVFASQMKLTSDQVESYDEEYFIVTPGHFNVHMYKTKLRDMGFKSSFEYVNGSDEVVYDSSKMIFDMKSRDKRSFRRIESEYRVASDDMNGVVFECKEAPLKNYTDFLRNPDPVIKFAFDMPQEKFMQIAGCDHIKYIRWRRTYKDGTMGIVLKRRIGINFYNKLA